MKKTIMTTLTVFGATVLFSTGALGADNLGSTTQGKIQYDEGHLVIDPLPPDNELPGGNFSNRLPNNLNFGYHPLQSLEAETWLAKEVDTSEIDLTGSEAFDELAAAYADSDPTVGNLAIEDNRGEAKGWSIKLKQMGEFAIQDTPEKTLGSTTLTFNLGEVNNNVSDDGINKFGDQVTIDPTGTEVEVLSAKVGNGAGLTQVPLTNFELNIPANIVKEAAVYTADLNWTVSTTP